MAKYKIDASKRMNKNLSVKISVDTYHRLFELKCAWRLRSFDATIDKLMEKAKKNENNH